MADFLRDLKAFADLESLRVEAMKFGVEGDKALTELARRYAEARPLGYTFAEVRERYFLELASGFTGAP